MPPVPPRLQRLSVRHFSGICVFKVPHEVEAFGEVSLDPIDHQQKPMTWKEKTRFLAFRVPIAERMTESLFLHQEAIFIFNSVINDNGLESN